jgi:hypothetical protein
VKIHNLFSIDGVSGVKNFKYMCFGLLLCLLSDESEFEAHFMVFRCACKIANDCYLHKVSVCPLGTTQLPLDESL